MARCTLLHTSSVLRISHIFGILAIIFARFGMFDVFRAFCRHVLRYQFATSYIHLVGGVTRQVEVSFQSRHFTYFTAKTRSKLIFCIHGLKNCIDASDLMYIYIVSVLTPSDFRRGWVIFCTLGDKNSRTRELVELPAVWLRRLTNK